MTSNWNFVNEFKLQLHTYVFNYCNMGSHGLIPEDKTTLQRCPIPISGIACKNKNLTLKLHFWNWSSFQKPVKEVQPEGSFGTDKGEGESPGPGVGGQSVLGTKILDGFATDFFLSKYLWANKNPWGYVNISTLHENISIQCILVAKIMHWWKSLDMMHQTHS